MNLGNYPCIKNDTAIINEIFLCARYMQKNNIEMQWTLKDWWNKCREIFLIVDSNSLDFFWYKYEWRFEQRFDTNYTTNFDQSIQHSDWLNLYTDNKFFKKNIEFFLYILQSVLVFTQYFIFFSLAYKRAELVECV